MESVLIIYICICTVIGMITSAATGQSSVGAMATWIVLSMILLPIVLVIAAVEYNKYKNTR